MHIDAQAKFEIAGTGELNMDNCNGNCHSLAKQKVKPKMADFFI